MATCLPKIELLAPAGRWKVLEAVLNAGADAVYLAGKEYNMRRHRSDFNFSRDEIARAADMVHAAGAKIYIAANSLLSDQELDQIGEYLQFLSAAAVDAIIVQDLGLVRLLTQSGLNLPLHASTMMNIHNAEGARACAGAGIRRIICSRDIALHQVKHMRASSGLEMEYFVHGDMCIAQSGQCYMSGILFGKSSNRGRCMKPCRWAYHMLNRRGDPLATRSDGPYLLATKDICLIKFIPELAEAGVSSLKIEGRMRTPDFMGTVVKAYRRALDEYHDDPLGYVNNMSAYDELYRNRIRDFSTCFAFKNPDGTLVGSSGSREPFFLSSAGEDHEIDLMHPGHLFPRTGVVHGVWPDHVLKPLLAVHAGSPPCAQEALERGADWIYIGGEVFPSRGQRWSTDAVHDTIRRAHDRGKKVGLLTPRITLARQLDELRWFLDRTRVLAPDAVLVHNLGSLHLVREHTDIPLYADFSFNVLNRRSVEHLHHLGARQVTVSLEASFQTLSALAAGSCTPLECIIHGPIPGMLLEHCLLSMSLMNTSSHDPCRGPCHYLECALSDKLRYNYPVEVDQFCRTHILLSKDLACLNHVADFVRTGVRTLRIEGQYYGKELLGFLTAMYAELIQDPVKSIAASHIIRLVALSPRGFTLGAYPKGICEDGFRAETQDPAAPGSAVKESPLAHSCAY